jgi:hypothetical protein
MLKMAKIYVKTVLLTSLLVFLLMLRFRLLKFSLAIPLPLSDFLCLTILAAIVINEKLTRGERWTYIHYLLLLIAMMFVSVIIVKVYSLS